MIDINKKLLRNSLALIALYTAAIPLSYASFPDVGNFHPVMSLVGGWQWMNSPNSHTYNGSDDDVFVYNYSHGSDQNAGNVGGFVGGEWQFMCHPALLGQLGLEYDYFWPTKFSGSNLVGIEPGTSTLYDFHYKVQSQQLLVAGKLLTTFADSIHPYISTGVGLAWNDTYDYSAATSETGSINVTPTFADHSVYSFAYRLGLGVDFDVATHARIGIGYQYNNFGNSNSKKGVVTFNDYQSPVPFSLRNSNLDSNQIVLTLSYFN